MHQKRNFVTNKFQRFQKCSRIVGHGSREFCQLCEMENILLWQHNDSVLQQVMREIDACLLGDRLGEIAHQPLKCEFKSPLLGDRLREIPHRHVMCEIV